MLAIKRNHKMSCPFADKGVIDTLDKHDIRYTVKSGQVYYDNQYEELIGEWYLNKDMRFQLYGETEPPKSWIEAWDLSRETTVEWCPYCNNEVVIPTFGVSTCPECGKPILPCSMCDMDKVNCVKCIWK